MKVGQLIRWKVNSTYREGIVAELHELGNLVGDNNNPYVVAHVQIPNYVPTVCKIYLDDPTLEEIERQY